jgi:hypothetical protein
MRRSSSDRADLAGADEQAVETDGERRLWALREGKPRAVSVRLGVDDGAYTEVVEGDLQPGDDLIVGERRGAWGSDCASTTSNPKSRSTTRRSAAGFTA